MSRNYSAAGTRTKPGRIAFGRRLLWNAEQEMFKRKGCGVATADGGAAPRRVSRGPVRSPIPAGGRRRSGGYFVPSGAAVDAPLRRTRVDAPLAAIAARTDPPRPQ